MHQVRKKVDPICGMTVEPATAAGSYEYKETVYYFCSTHCLEKFRSDPEAFLHTFAPTALVQPIQIQHARTETSSHQSDGTSRHPGTTYTCPMHPEILRDAPGSCPICGMALEPRTITLDEPENPEIREMSRRFWVSLVLTLPLLMIGMSEFVPSLDLERMMPMPAWSWLELALATPVVLWGAFPFFVRAWQSIVNRSLNMFTLIGLGSIGANAACSLRRQSQQGFDCGSR